MQRLYFVSRAAGGVFALDIKNDITTNIVDEPVLNSRAIASVDDVIYRGFSGCNSESYIEKTAPDGKSEIITPQEGSFSGGIMALKAASDGLLYVLATDWPVVKFKEGNFAYNSQIIVFDPDNKIIVQRYKLPVPNNSYFSNLTLIEKEDGSVDIMVCDEYEGMCYRMPMNGQNAERIPTGYKVSRGFDNTTVTSDGIMYVGIGPEHAGQGGEPTTVRTLLEFNTHTNEFVPLIESEFVEFGARITPALYETEEGVGLYVIFGPPDILYNISPENLQKIKTEFNYVPTLSELIDRGYVEFVSNLPIDSGYAISVRYVEESGRITPHIVVPSSIGLIEVWPAP